MEKELYYTHNKLISKLNIYFDVSIFLIFKYDNQFYNFLLKYGLMYKEDLGGGDDIA